MSSSSRLSVQGNCNSVEQIKMPILLAAIRLSLVTLICVAMRANGHAITPAVPIADVAILPPSSKNFQDPTQIGALNAIVNAYKVWGAGSTLSVCFIGGDEGVKRLFIDSEREWEKFANLKWNFGSAPNYRSCDMTHPSHIRVSFDQSGHWSRVGTDSINNAVVKLPSLNIDIAEFGNWALADKRHIRGVMLHEQGHALGLEHEHQSPNSPCIAHIRWQVVYSEMSMPPNSWDRDKVDQNLKALVDTERLRTTSYDPTSIMHYSFPANWFDKPNCAVGENEQLSELDKREIALAYPKESKDQQKFVESVSTAVKAATNRLNLSDEDKKALQQDINSVNRANLDPRLQNGAVMMISIAGNNSGVITGPINQETTGDCSPAVAGVEGSVTITASNCDKKQ
jgi:hypothetical protein